jgi:hypothetical protein
MPTKPGEKPFPPTVELGQLLSIGIYVIVLCRERKKIKAMLYVRTGRNK